jgi:hypothetical protein
MTLHPTLPIDTGTDRVAINKNGTGTDSRAGALLGETVLLSLGRHFMSSRHACILWGDSCSRATPPAFEPTLIEEITLRHGPAHFEETVFLRDAARFGETVLGLRRHFEFVEETPHNLCGDELGGFRRRVATLEETGIDSSSSNCWTSAHRELFECSRCRELQQPSPPPNAAADAVSRSRSPISNKEGDRQ